jgi:hypothetical protein
MALGLNLYMQHRVKPNTLCRVVLLQQGEIRSVGFESNSRERSNEAAHDYLFDTEVTEGFEAAVLIIDGQPSLYKRKERRAGLMLGAYTPHTCAQRNICYHYERVRGEVMPLCAPVLVGEWNDVEMERGEQWVLEGIRDFHRDNNTVM